MRPARFTSGTGGGDERADGRCVIAIVATASLGRAGAMAADDFHRLNGAQIRAKFTGMEMTDEVHWGDYVYQRNGTLRTYSMGHKTLASGG